METKYFFPFDQQLCLGFYGKGHDETPKLGFCQLARVTTTTSLHLRKNAVYHISNVHEFGDIYIAISP